MERSLPPLKTFNLSGTKFDFSDFSELKSELQDTKKSVNALQQQNVCLSTRKKSVEKDTARRTRLLKELWSLSKANQQLSRDLVDRLCDDRNSLSLYRQQCKMLGETLVDREEEIANLKHQQTFTKIVELEGALAALQSEAKRLCSLCEQPSPELNKAAESEIQAYQTLFEALQKDVTTLESQRLQQIEEISDKQNDYQVLSVDLRETEDELTYEQKQLETVSKRYRTSVDKIKQKEELSQQVEAFRTREMAVDKETEQLQNEIEQLVKDSDNGRYTLTQDKFEELGVDLIKLLARIRSRCLAQSLDYPHAPTVLEQLQEADQDDDGQLSVDEIFQIVRRSGLDVERAEIALIVNHLSPNGENHCIVLDFFLACLLSPPVQDLADPTEEQIKELTERLPYETFRAALLRAEDFIAVTALGGAESKYWARLWEVHGAGGVLLRVPAWQPQSDVLKLRLLNSWENSKLEEILRASGPIETEEQLNAMLTEACEDDYGPTDISELMKMYASAPDLRNALIESLQ
eukprot:GEMP01036993.1.p1 GENE.GEMP01036993.1~~GEMP01036993.1.p1  ORF type:complete len:521 (+),score=140.15 GEMP01036993.1:84-1646(+)